MMKKDISRVLQKIEEVLAIHKKNSLLHICEILQQHIPHYHWVGFYFMNDATQTLEIGPYVGAKTEHVSIPYGKGICGQVAVSGKTFEVPDVAEATNYIACSATTQAEMVVPIFKKDKLIAQLDIDSHDKDPFTQDDWKLLTKVCALVAEVL